MKRKRGKKGEITSTQIVTFFLLLAGFVILLLFLPALFKIFGKGEVNRDVCHLSVIARASAPAGSAWIPLKCTTEKVCVSESGKDDACSDKQFAGEKEIRGVKLEGSDEEKAKIIEKEIADSMLFCWQMIGEGKLDLFRKVSDSKFIPKFTESKPKCLVCSRLAFTSDIKSGILENINVNEYMANEMPSETLAYTYLELMTDVGVQVPASAMKESSGTLNDQIAILFSQIKTERGPFEEAFKTAGIGFVAYGTSLFTPVLGRLTGNTAGFVVSLLGIVGASAIAGAQTRQGQVNAIGHCTDFFETEELASKGCSVVRAIEWNEQNIDNINQYCTGGIGGNL